MRITTTLLACMLAFCLPSPGNAKTPAPVKKSIKSRTCKLFVTSASCHLSTAQIKALEKKGYFPESISSEEFRYLAGKTFAVISGKVKYDGGRLLKPGDLVTNLKETGKKSFAIMTSKLGRNLAKEKAMHRPALGWARLEEYSAEGKCPELIETVVSSAPDCKQE